MSGLSTIEEMLRERASEKLGHRLNDAFEVPHYFSITVSLEEIEEFLMLNSVAKTQKITTNTLLKYLSDMVYDAKIKEAIEKQTADFVKNVYEFKNQLANIDDPDNFL
ncbi:MAG: hypothetical protein ACE5I1_12435 [bacterium]